MFNFFKKTPRPINDNKQREFELNILDQNHNINVDDSSSNNKFILDEEKRNNIALNSDQSQNISHINILRRSLSLIGDTINNLFRNKNNNEINDILNELESIFISADVGIDATEKILNDLRKAIKLNNIKDVDNIKKTLYEILINILVKIEGEIYYEKNKPLVLIFVGINGAGKTTSIGKLSDKLNKQGKKILLVAGDTFRAAANEQLSELAKRNEIKIFSSDKNDPASISFDAVNFGIKNNFNVIMIDTAGRLHTQSNLMNELKKIKKVISKFSTNISQETILVIDGNIGQNSVSQIESFSEIIGINGIILTKLDGTAKGGVLLSLATNDSKSLKIPIYYLGTGEKKNDLYKFSSNNFIRGLLNI